MRSPSQSTSEAESVDVGSSSSSTRGSRATAFAISIFWRVEKREVAHQRVRVHIVEAETGEVLDDGALAPAPVDLAPRPAVRKAAACSG